MGPNLSADLSRLHQQELLHEAEHERLVAQALAASASSAAEPAFSRWQRAIVALDPSRLLQLANTPAWTPGK
jgi:hypothetical protein